MLPGLGYPAFPQARVSIYASEANAVQSRKRDCTAGRLKQNDSNTGAAQPGASLSMTPAACYFTNMPDTLSKSRKTFCSGARVNTLVITIASNDNTNPGTIS